MPPHITRRRFLGYSALAAAGLAFYSGEIERHELWLTRQTVFLRDLPDSFRGFTIAQISDIHYDEFTEPFFVRHVVNRVNQLKPDMVALTGDFVTDSPRSLEWGAAHASPCAEILSRLTAPLRYAVMGNHDAAVGPAKVTDALVSHGIPVLANSHVALDRKGDRIWIAGLNDATFMNPSVQKAVPEEAMRRQQPVILLGHEPDYADTVAQQLSDRRVDLMLAGHTHGGQIRLHFFGNMFKPPLGKKYIRGLFQIGGLQLYVNRGIGTVNMPLRFRCPPEVTLFTLQRAIA